MTDKISQHIGWLKQYIEGMTAANWADMRLRADRQLAQLSKDLDAHMKEMTDDMVERVARALHDAHGAGIPYSAGAGDWRDMARAAIKATMREPNCDPIEVRKP